MRIGKDGTMASITNLPPELLLEIFEYLPLKDVLTVKNVCDDWASLTTYKCLYKEVTVHADVRLEELLNVLYTHGNVVEVVTLTDRKDANAILKALAKCRNLKCLSMKNCTGTDVDCVSTSHLINVFRKTNLSQFSIKHCTCFVHVLSILPPEPHTRKMVGFSSNGTNSATQNLHFLGPHFFSMLETSADSLTYLSIVDANINFVTTDFPALFRLIGNCRKLRELSYHVCYLPISDDNFRQLYNLHSLVSLSLKSLRRVSCEVFENFFQPCRTVGIKKLELYDIGGLTASTIRHIGYGCPNLEDLAIHQFTGAREAVLNRDIVEELTRSFTKLRTVKLSYVDESIIEVLILLPKKLTHLKFIEFEVLTRSDFILKLKTALTECLSHFDVKFSLFGRVTCQLKRQYLIKSNLLNLKC